MIDMIEYQRLLIRYLIYMRVVGLGEIKRGCVCQLLYYISKKSCRGHILIALCLWVYLYVRKSGCLSEEKNMTPSIYMRFLLNENNSDPIENGNLGSKVNSD